MSDFVKIHRSSVVLSGAGGLIMKVSFPDEPDRKKFQSSADKPKETTFPIEITVYGDQDKSLITIGLPKALMEEFLVAVGAKVTEVL